MTDRQPDTVPETAGTPFASALPAFVPPFLARPERPLRTIIGAYLLAFLGSLALAAIVSLLVPSPEGPDFADLSGGMAIFLLVIFAPLTETLVMGAILLVLLRFLTPLQSVLFSAFGWGIAHSLSAATWGLVIWWPFLIFSTLFVVWRQRSIAWAFLMPAIVHAMQNLLPALSVAFPGLLPDGL